MSSRKTLISRWRVLWQQKPISGIDPVQVCRQDDTTEETTATSRWEREFPGCQPCAWVACRSLWRKNPALATLSNYGAGVALLLHYPTSSLLQRYKTLSGRSRHPWISWISVYVPRYYQEAAHEERTWIIKTWHAGGLVGEV